MEQQGDHTKEVVGWLTVAAFIGTAMATGSIPDAMTAVFGLWLTALVGLGVMGALTGRHPKP